VSILDQFKDSRKIEHGASSDEKYYVKSADDKELFLRIFDEKLYLRREEEFEMMQRLVDMGVPIARPVDFDLFEDKGYYTTEWLEGKPLSRRKNLSNNEMYKYGLIAGKALKRFIAYTLLMKIGLWISLRI